MLTHGLTSPGVVVTHLGPGRTRRHVALGRGQVRGVRGQEDADGLVGDAVPVVRAIGRLRSEERGAVELAARDQHHEGVRRTLVVGGVQHPRVCSRAIESASPPTLRLQLRSSYSRPRRGKRSASAMTKRRIRSSSGASRPR